VDRAGGAERLEVARRVLRRLDDRPAVRPAVEPGADGRLLPVVAPLAGLLPGGGLRRGWTVAVTPGPGATSLLIALLAGASAAGAWAGVVGRPDLGLVAAAEAGVALERLALVPYPGADAVAVAASLLDGLDVVAVGVGPEGVRAADRRRLAVRARQRGAVLVPFGPWPGADAELGCARVEWQGVGDGPDGRLRARRVHVLLRGRGVPPAGREARLLLPGGSGRAAADPAAGWEADVGAGTPVASEAAAREAG
jgi:hypothetical protein